MDVRLVIPAVPRDVGRVRNIVSAATIDQIGFLLVSGPKTLRRVYPLTFMSTHFEPDAHGMNLA
jgi:hypothetical protein